LIYINSRGVKKGYTNDKGVQEDYINSRGMILGYDVSDCLISLDTHQLDMIHLIAELNHPFYDLLNYNFDGDQLQEIIFAINDGANYTLYLDPDYSDSKMAIFRRALLNDYEPFQELLDKKLSEDQLRKMFKGFLKIKKKEDVCQ